MNRKDGSSAGEISDSGILNEKRMPGGGKINREMKIAKVLRAECLIVFEAARNPILTKVILLLYSPLTVLGCGWVWKSIH